jgi:hypothetical protein
VIDCEYGMRDNDREALELVRHAGVPYQLVLTKADKIMYRRLLRSFLPRVEDFNQRHTDRILKACRRVRRDVAAFDPNNEAEGLSIIATSAVLRHVSQASHIGIDYLRYSICRATGNIPKHLQSLLPPKERPARDKYSDLIEVEDENVQRKESVDVEDEGWDDEDEVDESSESDEDIYHNKVISAKEDNCSVEDNESDCEAGLIPQSTATARDKIS